LSSYEYVAEEFEQSLPHSSEFRVAIDWGDGVESPGTLFRRNDGVYEVRGHAHDAAAANDDDDDADAIVDADIDVNSDMQASFRLVNVVGIWKHSSYSISRTPDCEACFIVSGGAEAAAPGATGGPTRTGASQRECSEQGDARQDAPPQHQEPSGADVGGQVGVDDQI